MTTKQLDIKNKTYYFYNDLINLSNFSINNLKSDKKTWILAMLAKINPRIGKSIV